MGDTAVSIQQNAFISGEVSADLYTRVDAQFYQQALRIARNFFIDYHGGCVNDPGTEMIAQAKSLPFRLIPFQFNTSDTYALEFGDEYMRVIRNGAVVLTGTSKAITGITQAAEAVVSSTAHGFTNGRWVFLASIVGMTELNNRYFIVSDVTANSYKIKDTISGDYIDTTGFGAYVSGGTGEQVFELTTPYVAADLFRLKFTQSADIMTITHPTYQQRELSRTGHAAWSLDVITFAPDQAAPTSAMGSGGGSGSSTYQFVVTAISDTDELEESLPSNVVTLTSKAENYAATPITISWTAAAGASKYNIYRADNGVFGFIGTTPSTSFIDDFIEPDVTDTPPEARNPFDAVGKYPQCVEYHQQRIGYAGSNNERQKAQFSKSSAFHNFTRASPPKDNDAIVFSLAARQVQEIRHMVSMRKLLMFTSGTEWLVTGGAEDVLKPINVFPDAQSYNGCSHVRPLIVGNTVLYIQEKGNIVRDLGFTITVDGFDGEDITVRSNHLFEHTTIVDWDYSAVPFSLIWAILDTGEALSLAYFKKQNVVAWTPHDTDGLYKTVCAISEGQQDSVYFGVQRTIDGNTVGFIERLKNRKFQTLEDSFFVHCGLSYDGRNASASTMTLTGGTTWEPDEEITLDCSVDPSTLAIPPLVDDVVEIKVGTDIVRCRVLAVNAGDLDVILETGVPVALRDVATTSWSVAKDEFTIRHLRAKTVSILMDGNVDPQQVVGSDGEVTLTREASVVHIGLPYNSDFETLDIDTGQQTVRDRRKSVPTVTVVVKESRGIFAGRKAGEELKLQEAKQRSTEGWNEATRLVTGNAKINIPHTWDDSGRVFIRQSDPLPLTILSVIPQIVVEGK